MSTDIGKFIKERRIALGKTQRDIANEVGATEATVSRWESGHIDNMRRDKIASLAKALRISPMQLISDEPAPPVDGLPVIPIDDRTFRVPVVGRVAAGQPIVADEEIIGYEYIDNKYSKDGYEYFGLRIVGKSMEPTIMDGDIVIVRRQDYIESGQIGIILIDGECATAKEVKESPEGITLIGHNAAVYTPHFYSAQEVKNLPVQIIGRVIQSIRKF